MQSLSRKSTVVALLSLAIGAALALGGASSARAEEFRIATLAPDGSAWMKILSKGADEVKSATTGRVTFKYYPGGVQGDEKEAISKMQLGQLDGAAVTATGLSQIDESVRVLELPRLFATVEELDYVRDRMWPTFQERFAKKGFMLGEPGDVGFIHFYSNVEVKALADLRKAKVWLWAEDKIVRALFKKLKVEGVPMGVPDVMTALNTGRIDACYASPLAAVALQWYTKIKYSTSAPLSYGISSTVLKLDKWNKLPAEDRKLVEKVLKIQGGKLRTTVRKDNLRALKSMTRGGVKVVDTPATMIAELEKASAEVWKEQVGKIYSQDDLDKVMKYRAEFRAKGK
jgi:TRAP-type C4-dicarboxylate transport system substrate-binding protein